MYKDEFIKDCFLAALNQIANKDKIEDTSYLYMPHFGFDYRESSSINSDVGEGIVNRWDGTWDGGSHWILNHDTCLEIVRQDEITLAECTKILNTGKLFMIWSDVYDCPWTMFYQQRNFRHVYVITGIKDDKFICQDEFFDVTDYAYEAKVAFSHFDSVNLVRTYHSAMGLDVIKQKMLFYLRKYEKTIVSAYDHFSSDLVAMDISTQHVKDNNYYGNMILTKLKNLSRYRYGYENFLRQLSNDYGINLYNERAGLLESAELWSRLVMILLKLFIKSKPVKQVEICVVIINKISELEYQILDGLLQFCQN